MGLEKISPSENFILLVLIIVRRCATKVDGNGKVVANNSLVSNKWVVQLYSGIL